MTGILAYIGPGAGVSLVGALVGFIGSIAFALFMVVLHPIRTFLRKRRKQRNPEAAELPVGSAEPIES